MVPVIYGICSEFLVYNLDQYTFVYSCADNVKFFLRPPVRRPGVYGSMLVMHFNLAKFGFVIFFVIFFLQVAATSNGVNCWPA